MFEVILRNSLRIPRPSHQPSVGSLFWKMMRICGRRDVGTAIICRSCWDNAERRGGGIVGGGGGGGDTETSFDETRVFSTECFPILRGIVIVTGIVILIFSSCTHLLDPGVLSLCRRFLNQFDTWKVKSKKNELNLIWFEPVWHLETKTRMRKQCKCGSKVHIPHLHVSPRDH